MTTDSHADADTLQVVCPSCGKTNRLPAARAAERPDCGACGAALFPGKPIALGDPDFDRWIARTQLPVVVDFWAAWCGPCKMMAPQFEQAAGALAGRVQFVKVDTDANPGLSQRFAVRSIPTLVLLQHGREVRRQPGAMQKAQILQWLGAVA